MRIEFVDRSDYLGETHRAAGERHLHYALARFGLLVRKVTVVTQDTNGPRGGVDKHCRMSAELSGAGGIHVEDVSDSWESCLSQAAKRLGRAVTRVAERRSRGDRRDLGMGNGTAAAG